ncbi:unnamed protein product [Rotaria socialis]|uniref:F-box domain-containing protein n=1 Tax=Rotaria socialis TaxID=392032 RepID=A0A821WJA9_9BILA|nr:unnamed protein product [Rotaria socialis]
MLIISTAHPSCNYTNNRNKTTQYDQKNYIYTMDSGPFLDIIPILLGHLDLLSLIRLAQACRFWKRRIYGDLKLWPNVIELPFICHMRVYDCKCHDTEKTIQVK